MRRTEGLTETLKSGWGKVLSIKSFTRTEESVKSLAALTYLLASELTTVRKAEGKVFSSVSGSTLS